MASTEEMQGEVRPGYPATGGSSRSGRRPKNVYSGQEGKEDTVSGSAGGHFQDTSGVWHHVDADGGTVRNSLDIAVAPSTPTIVPPYEASARLEYVEQFLASGRKWELEVVRVLLEIRDAIKDANDG